MDELGDRDRAGVCEPEPGRAEGEIFFVVEIDCVANWLCHVQRITTKIQGTFEREIGERATVESGGGVWLFRGGWRDKM